MPYVHITCVRCGTASRPMVTPRRKMVRYCGKACLNSDRREAADRALPARFWKQVEKDVGEERHPGLGLCWEWRGRTNPRRFGYGVVSVYRTMVAAHRVAWMVDRGPIPEGLWVLHRCDNPVCVRPDHLFLGTHHDNMADMRRKGRGPSRTAWCLANPTLVMRGERHPCAKLTVAKVIEIRRRIASGETQQAVADSYGVKRESVREIIKGRNWAWVEEEKSA